MDNMIPTKASLMKAKTMLEFSQKGYELLDKKRSVLIREMMALIEETETIQNKIDTIFKDAYLTIKYVCVTMGVNAVKEIALSVPKNEEITILTRSVMGVEIPFIKDETAELTPYYGFFRTNSALDIAVTKMKRVQKLIYHLAEVENSVYRLATEVKKTTKRANALNKIQIPKYLTICKRIEEVLEEKEREDFFRLKRVKDKTDKT